VLNNPTLTLEKAMQQRSAATALFCADNAATGHAGRLALVSRQARTPAGDTEQ
jgi:hypothetical protein